MRYFEDEAGRPPVAAGHLLKQDGVDAQTGGGVGGLAQQPRGQTGTHTHTHKSQQPEAQTGQWVSGRYPV